MKLEEECDNIFPEDNNVEQKMRICFNNVTFSYPGQNKDTIHDLNLKIDYGREFDTLKCKKVPQSLEIGLFFCQIFIFII